jgi:hypothetical protein
LRHQVDEPLRRFPTANDAVCRAVESLRDHNAELLRENLAIFRS